MTRAPQLRGEEQRSLPGYGQVFVQILVSVHRTCFIVYVPANTHPYPFRALAAAPHRSARRDRRPWREWCGPAVGCFNALGGWPWQSNSG